MQQYILFELLEIKASLNFCKLFTNASSKQGVGKHDKLLCFIVLPLSVCHEIRKSTSKLNQVYSMKAIQWIS